MTVAELIKELEQMPQDAEVVCEQSDGYGDFWWEDVTDLVYDKEYKQIRLI